MNEPVPNDNSNGLPKNNKKTYRLIFIICCFLLVSVFSLLVIKSVTHEKYIDKENPDNKITYSYPVYWKQKDLSRYSNSFFPLFVTSYWSVLVSPSGSSIVSFSSFKYEKPIDTFIKEKKISMQYNPKKKTNVISIDYEKNIFNLENYKSRINEYKNSINPKDKLNKYSSIIKNNKENFVNSIKENFLKTKNELNSSFLKFIQNLKFKSDEIKSHKSEFKNNIKDFISNLNLLRETFLVNWSLVNNKTTEKINGLVFNVREISIINNERNIVLSLSNYTYTDIATNTNYLITTANSNIVFREKLYKEFLDNFNNEYSLGLFIQFIKNKPQLLPIYEENTNYIGKIIYKREIKVAHKIIKSFKING